MKLGAHLAALGQAKFTYMPGLCLGHQGLSALAGRTTQIVHQSAPDDQAPLAAAQASLRHAPARPGLRGPEQSR